jgi:excisionase family DNA binding protein
MANAIKTDTNSTNGGNNSVFLTVNEVCKLLRITRPTLRRWTEQNLLKAYKIGGKVLYCRKEVIDSVYLTSTKNKSYKQKRGKL